MLNKISCHIPLICRNESSQKGFLNIGEILYQNNVLGKITGPLSTARDKSVFCSAHGILMNQTIESDLRIHVKSDLDLLLTAGVKMPLQKWQDSPASSRIFPFLEQWNLTGNVGGDVNFYYGEGRTYGDASLTCRDMNVRYKGTDFAVSGLNFMMKFPDFPRMISEPDLQADFTTLSQGKTMMRDGKILFHVNQKNECMVDSFHASMMKGMIQAEPFGLLDVVNGKKEISAVCTNFELASLLKQ